VGGMHALAMASRRNLFRLFDLADAAVRHARGDGSRLRNHISEQAGLMTSLFLSHAGTFSQRRLTKMCGPCGENWEAGA
jgi:hypothetical protein